MSNVDIIRAWKAEDEDDRDDKDKQDEKPPANPAGELTDEELEQITGGAVPRTYSGGCTMLDETACIC